MNLKNTRERYGSVAKGFHWLVALIVLGLLPLGFFMTEMETSPLQLELYWWHKSFGTLVLYLAALRLLWRFANRRPEHIALHKMWERRLAALVHVLLYAGILMMPLSGWVMSSAADFTHSFFGLFDMPHITPKNRALFRAAENVHEIGALALLLGILLHGAGAFKHHFIDRDATLARMLPVPFPRLGAALALLAFALLAGGAVILGPVREFAVPDKVGGEQAAPALPAGEAAAVEDSAAVQDAAAPHWSIVQEQSEIGFSVEVQGDAFGGQFTDFSGEIYFDPQNLGASAVDMRVRTASVKTGSDDRDHTITLPIWLGSSAFPEARFYARTFEQTGEGSFIARGELTLRGVSEAISVPFTLDFSQTQAGETQAVMDGAFTLPRLAFGVGQNEWASPEMVAHSVVVHVSLTALKR